MEEHAQEIEDLLRRAGPAWEHHECVSGAHEGFEPLLDVRHDHEGVDDGVRRLRRDDPGLADADVAPRANALLRMRDRRALHGTLHRARAAARADVQPAQAELVADVLRVVVLEAADRVPAPAHDEIEALLRAQDPGVAQDVEDGVRDAVGGRWIEAPALRQLDLCIEDVAQDREEVFLDALIILPSTNAISGALRTSSLMPRSCWTISTSKSGYCSNTAAASST
jgi:hypothetical protein